MSKQVFNEIPRLTVKGEALHQLAQSACGAYEQNILRLAANVADRETITIGDESFQIVVYNTDSTFNASRLDNTTGLDCIEDWTAHGFAVGQILRCENEFLRVKRVLSVDQVVLSRGYAGSTVASHADTTDVFKQGATALTAGKVTVPIGATLTPAAAGPQLATGLTALNEQGFTVTYAANALTFTREANGLHEACSETLGGTDNVWAAANTYGGVEKGELKYGVAIRVPNATEDALDSLSAKFPFTVTWARATVHLTADNSVVAWDGAITLSGQTVTLGNAGAVDWAATHTILIEAFGN